MTLPRLQISSTLMAFLLAIHFTLFLNMTIFTHAYEIFSGEENFSIFFMLSVPVLFVTMFTMLFLPFTIKNFEKPFFILLLLVSSLVNFAMYNYKVIFDYNMIDNIFSTDSAEAGSYANLTVILWFGLTGIIPAVLLFFTKITHPPFLKDVMVKLGVFLTCVVIVLIMAFFFYKDYASLVRNNTTLKREIVPNYYIGSTFKYFKRNYFTPTLEYQKIGLDAKVMPREGTKKNLTVILVGETARSMNYQLNGYDKPTNAHSRDIKNLISFQNVRSCGTATAVSLPCMFSFLGKDHYSKPKARNQDNLTNILPRAGVDTIWIDNNTGSQGIVKDDITYIEAPRAKSEFCDGTVCNDDYFIPELEKQIKSLKTQDTVLFLHIMGSHGPTYFKRYPDDHKKFTPSCEQSDIQNCTDEEIVNTYDNTILFTDYVMANIIKILQKHEGDLNSSMLYVSDHGESLGENGLYLHGMPYALAPEQQTHVPLITWLSDGEMKAQKLNQSCLEKKAKSDHFSHDNFAQTILGLSRVQTEVYKPELDILASCRG